MTKQLEKRTDDDPFGFIEKRTDNLFLIIRCYSLEGFFVVPEEPPPPDEFDALLQAHCARLWALIEKHVILSVAWNDEDTRAVVQVIHDPEVVANPFGATFELDFPTIQ